jgi:hypothetical protein
MTIHSDWARLLYDECPEAFHDQIPSDGDFDVGIIDGHLQLMCVNECFGTWERALQALFVRPIQRLFDAGCKTVVLCFDSYDHVPVYKSMTQQKRVSRVAPASQPFGEGDELPERIPHDTMTYLMNRAFKLKVVQLALARVPGMVQFPEGGGKLIVDYKSAVEYSSGEPVPVQIPDLTPLGESDIKYVRYVQRFGNALVHAIDGDYLTIALLFYAKYGLGENNRIFLFRQLSELGGSSVKEEDDKDDDKTKKKRKRPPTPKCWVDTQLLFVVLTDSMRQSMSSTPIDPRTSKPFTECDLVHAAVLLMLCAGTDFSRSLPLLGPKRLWELLPNIASALVRGAPEGTEPSTELIANAVVEKLYACVFAKHVPNNNGPTWELDALMQHLKVHSKLAESTRARLPTPAQVHVTLQNVAWVMTYWTTFNDHAPTPLDGSCGYVRCPLTHRVTFADAAASPA